MEEDDLAGRIFIKEIYRIDEEYDLVCVEEPKSEKSIHVIKWRGRLEACIKAGRNPLIGLLTAN